MADLFKKLVLKGITDTEIAAFLKGVRVLKLDEYSGKYYYGRGLTKKYRGVSFMWNLKQGFRAKKLREFARVPTRHRYGYHGMFKPDLEEVVAQIPVEMRARTKAFYTVTPDDINNPDWLIDLWADGTFENKRGMDPMEHMKLEHENLQNTVTILFEEDKTAGALNEPPRPPTAIELERERESQKRREESDRDWNFNRQNAFFLVAAEESHKIWAILHKQEGMTWTQDRCFIHTVGTKGLSKKPVCVETTFDIVNGELVCFYRTTSLARDPKMVEKWLKKNFPNTEGRCTAENLQPLRDALSVAMNPATIPVTTVGGTSNVTI